MSAGEAVGDAVFAYCRDALGVTVNEMFGQTEINYIVGNCRAARRPRPATPAGRPPRQHGPALPGPPRRGDRRRQATSARAARPATWRCTGATSTATPTRCSSSATGRTTPPRAPSSPATGDSWCRTGDMAVMDDDGYLWYQGRSRRHVQGRGLPHRPERDRELPGQAPGGGQRRGGAQARRRARRGGQGLRRAGRRAVPATRATDRSETCRPMCAASSRPTSTRRRSSSSTRCR